MRAQRLKVTMATTSYPLNTDHVSGLFIEQLTLALSKRLDLIVVTPADNKCTKPSSTIKTFRYAPKKFQILAHQPGGIPVALRKSRMSWVLLAPFLISMFYAIMMESKKSDIIFSNWSITGILSGVIGKTMKKPCVTTLRGEDVKRIEQSYISRFLTKMCILLNSYTICVSSDMQEKLTAIFPQLKEKILHIPNGVDKSLLKIEREQKTYRDDHINITCIGSLIPRKSFNTVIQAIAESKSKSIHLNIAGDGPEKAHLKKQISDLRLQNKVSLLGSLTQNEIQLLLKNTDIFIIPSLSEGRPNVLIEAMASKLPIIATSISGITEVIIEYENGLLFPPESYNTLRKKIDELIENPSLSTRIAKNARITVIEKKLTWDNCANSYIDTFSRLLEK